MTLASFYSRSHWGSRWGVIDAAHPIPHKGLDCGLFHGRVDVPALHAGEVVVVASSSSVGHYVTISRADGLFDTFGHIVPGVSVGEVVAQGERLGRQAVTQAEGGRDWLGQHTHLALSNTLTGWAIWGVHNLDPTPGVIAALDTTTTAGGSPAALIEQEENRMHIIAVENGTIALIGGPGHARVFTNYVTQQFEIEAWEAVYGHRVMVTPDQLTTLVNSQNDMADAAATLRPSVPLA